MPQDTPRVSTVSAKADGQNRQVSVSWSSGRDHDLIELTGWIATGGETLAPLADPAMFATAHVAEHGRAVAWGWSEDEHGDLMIDPVLWFYLPPSKSRLCESTWFTGRANTACRTKRPRISSASR